MGLPSSQQATPLFQGKATVNPTAESGGQNVSAMMGTQPNLSSQANSLIESQPAGNPLGDQHSPADVAPLTGPEASALRANMLGSAHGIPGGFPFRGLGMGGF